MSLISIVQIVQIVSYSSCHLNVMTIRSTSALPSVSSSSSTSSSSLPLTFIMTMMMTMMMMMMMMMMTLIGVNDLTFIQDHLGAAISCAVMSRLRLNPIDSSLIHLCEITSYRSYWPVLTKNNYNVTP